MKALEKKMPKATRTTGNYRTRGARIGVIMDLSNSKSRMAKVFAALTGMESLGWISTTILSLPDDNETSKLLT